ncbi:HypC/HybG/HupF family hydrogenase formation chaperone [Patescibacteria group bacterium]
MCLAIPVEVISTKNTKVVVSQIGKKRQVNGSLCRVKAGDFVILQNNYIIRKISKEQAKEIITLLK